MDNWHKNESRRLERKVATLDGIAKGLCFIFLCLAGLLAFLFVGKVLWGAGS